VSLTGVRAELDVLMAGWTETHKATHPMSKDRHPIIALPLKGEVLGSLATTLWILQGAVLLVLLIAIANVTNLLLLRAIERQRETAVRLALGISRVRLARHLMLESATLALAGGGIAIVLARWAGPA
jgi:ABC-type antimicrobial peptide transport system permease subunit